jgi:hypothetical protein
MGDELPEKQDLVALAREDMQWLDQNPELLCSRTERFIAVYRKEIVGSGNNSEEALQAGRASVQKRYGKVDYDPLVVSITRNCC